MGGVTANSEQLVNSESQSTPDGDIYDQMQRLQRKIMDRLDAPSTTTSRANSEQRIASRGNSEQRIVSRSQSKERNVEKIGTICMFMYI